MLEERAKIASITSQKPHGFCESSQSELSTPMLDAPSLVLLLAVVPIAVLASCACCKYRSESLTLVAPKRKEPTDMIPPLFFTGDVKDPLLQEDLTEHIPDAQIKSAYV
jgi:hypothetical protein